MIRPVHPPRPEKNGPVKVVFASDSFKGSLSAAEACAAMRQGVLRARTDVTPVLLPMADGGEGTLEVLRTALGGTSRPVRITGPLGGRIEASLGFLEDGRTAVIETASAAGLLLVPPEARNPLRTTTWGLGEMIATAFRSGARRCIVGVGGSATADLGLGAMQGLGARLFDEAGNEIREPATGGTLERVARIDLSGLERLPKNSVLEIACDVDNPLLGPEGAAAVYGPQKGADPAMVAQLEQNLEHAATLLETITGRNVRDLPGAGAAGGIGAGLAAIYGAPLRSGADLVLEAVRFDERADGAHIVFTGEGRLEAQSARGKVVREVARASKALGVPAVALVGEIGTGWGTLEVEGLASAFSICPGPISLQESQERAFALLADAAERAFRLFAACPSSREHRY